LEKRRRALPSGDAGDLDPLPVAADNPVWRRPLTWWIEAEQFEAEHGRKPQTLEEYVAWSQQRQARALAIAVEACKARFPRCGGVLIWCGHDCYPCPANTSLIDFHGQPKPAAWALQRIWRAEPPS
jgi:beta-mannosidase